MRIERRQRYGGQGYSISKTNNKININFDISALNLMVSYILSENRNIRRSHIINMRNLFDIIDMNLYKNDPERLKRIDFIKKGLEGRLDYNLTNSEMIMRHINGGLIDDSIINLEEFTSMNNSEIEWINQTISESLKYSFIYNDIDRLLDACTRFKSQDYISKGQIVQEIERLIAEMQTKFRRAKAESSQEMTFSLDPEIFNECIKETYDQLSQPSNKLLCGMAGLNELTAGGFESARCYCLFGLPGEGKSTTMLDLAYQIKKYNPQYKTKDPTKTPCVVYFTLENTVKETISRLCNMTGIEGEMIDYNVDELIQRLKTEGELYITDNSPIDIIIKYQPGMSVDTSYLYTLVEDLEDQGKECICLILDYIKRIRSVYDSSGDLRLTLGSVVNELKVFSAIKDIPVITASQLNRDATKHIDESRKSNKADLVRMLGRSQIGESLLILENLDGGFLIAPEWTHEGQKYLGIQRIKARYKASDLAFIYQPYIIGNDIKLVEDLNAMAPVYRTTMRDDAAIMNNFNNGMNTGYPTNSIKNYDDIRLLANDNENDNVFLNASIVNKETATFVVNYQTAITHKPLMRQAITRERIA